jgi:hypothetical protein
MAQLAKIQNGAGPDKEWRPDTFHRVDPAQVGQKKLWWYQGEQGITVLSENAVRRTRGLPATLRRLQKQYAQEIDHAVGQELVVPLNFYDEECDYSPARWAEINLLVAAIMATESGGNVKARRYEKHLNDWSFGPMQMLTATASFYQRKGYTLFKALKPVPKGGDPAEWAAVLSDPKIALRLACRMLAYMNDKYTLKGDPILMYACYNAGGPYASTRTPWGLRAYDRDGPGPLPGALDHFAAWYGDACAVWGRR